MYLTFARAVSTLTPKCFGALPHPEAHRPTNLRVLLTPLNETGRARDDAEAKTSTTTARTAAQSETAVALATNAPLTKRMAFGEQVSSAPCAKWAKAGAIMFAPAPHIALAPMTALAALRDAETVVTVEAIDKEAAAYCLKLPTASH